MDGRVEVGQRLDRSTRSTAAGDRAAPGPGPTRSGGGACRPGWSTAGDSPVATSGTSTVSSSVMRTRKRSTWRVRRLTGWTWTADDEHRLRLLAVDRQVDQGVRAGVAAELLELVGVDRDAGRSRRRGRRRRPAGVRRGGGWRPSCRSGRDVRRQASRGRWTCRWNLRIGCRVCVGLRLAGGAGVARRPVAAARVPRVVRAGRRRIDAAFRARRCSIAAWQPPSSSSKTSTPSLAASSTPSSRRATRSRSPVPARRASTSRPARRPTSSCSTSGCPGWTASRSCAASARPAPRCRSSS